MRLRTVTLLLMTCLLAACQIPPESVSLGVAHWRGQGDCHVHGPGASGVSIDWSGSWVERE